MLWNVAPKYVALTFTLIILIYSREYNMIPTLKNKIFRLCLYVVVFSIILSILSIYAIENYAFIPKSLNHIIQIILSQTASAFWNTVYPNPRQAERAKLFFQILLQ